MKIVKKVSECSNTNVSHLSDTNVCHLSEIEFSKKKPHSYCLFKVFHPNWMLTLAHQNQTFGRARQFYLVTYPSNYVLFRFLSFSVSCSFYLSIFFCLFLGLFVQLISISFFFPFFSQKTQNSSLY